MKKVFLALAMLILSVITIQAASAAIVSGLWEPTDVTYKAIQDGESASFQWYAQTPNDYLSVTIFLEQNGQILKVLQDEDYPEDQSFASAMTTVTKADYLSPGTYTVRLYATDDLNLDYTKTLTLYVEGQPDADFTGIDVQADPTSGDAPLSVSFTCQATGGDAPVTYAWSFGDGASSSAQNPQHTYQSVGVYTATCTATDTDGDTISGTATVTATEPAAENLPPEMAAIPHQYVPENSYFFYQFDVSDPDNAKEELTCYDVMLLLKSTLYVPDWLTLDEDACTLSGTAPEVPTDVDYDIIVGVKDPAGLSDEEAFTLTVTDQIQDTPFTGIDVKANPSSGTAPLSVSFTCQATGGDAPVTYAWSFGDGASSSAQNPQHTYQSAGSYTATCTATDTDGDTISGTASVTASAAPVNHAPTISDVQDHAVDEETAYTQSFTISDPDGDDIECFSAADVGYGIALPSWLSLDKQTCTLSGTTPSVDQDEVFLITVGVKDEHGATDESYYYLTVKNVPVANNPPVAQFSWSPASPTTCDAVTFDASASSDSDGAIVSYKWDLDGDGSYDDATGVTATTSFSSTGNHMVRLKILDDDNDAATRSKWVLVSACDNDFTGIDFTATPTSGVAPLTVSFDCQATGGDAPISYLIAYGDSVSTTSQTHTHLYSVPGTYTATCTATDADGDTISDTQVITVTQPELENKDPTAMFSWSPASPTTCDAVTFDASASSDSDGAIVSYKWDLDNDGSYDDATGVTATKTFDTIGDHKVRLKVIDDDGAVATIAKTVTVSRCDHDFTGISVDANPTSGVAPLSVSFTCQATGGDAPVTYAWSFGDGSSSSSQNPQHTYQSAGSYTATCTATDTDGDKLSGTVGIVVSAKPVAPTADFTWSPINPVEDQLVSFDASASSDSDGTIVLYQWDFDNDGVWDKTDVTANHVFTAPGTYPVTLRVTDDDGLTATKKKTVTVGCDDKPITGIDFTATPDNGYAPLSVSFTCSATGGDAPLAYAISFGDGSTVSSQANPTHVYTVPGTYTATCTVTDADGDHLSATEVITVSAVPNQAPVAAFTYAPSAPVTDELVSFDASNSYDADGVIVLYEWDFDADGVFDATGKYVAHSFASVGNHEVVLRVTDDDGATDMVSKTVPVARATQLPVAIAGPDQSVLVQSVVSVDGSASYDPDGGNIVTYAWDFGNGDSAVGSSPLASTIYVSMGTYSVTLTVTDDEGQTDTDTLLVTVNALPEKPECSDGRDNDGDGLVDYPEDPGCYGPEDPKEYNVGGFDDVKNARDLKVVSIAAYGSVGYEAACSDDMVTVEVVLENDAGQDLEDLRVGYSVPELGVQQKSSQFDLDDGDRLTKTFVVYLPYDVSLGEYYTEITVANDDIRRSLHRMLAIVC